MRAATSRIPYATNALPHIYAIGAQAGQKNLQAQVRWHSRLGRGVPGAGRGLFHLQALKAREFLPAFVGVLV
jgi:hypothetical protein